jgi:hypothetical protein
MPPRSLAQGGLSRLAIARLKSAGMPVAPLLKRVGLTPELIAEPEERLKPAQESSVSINDVHDNMTDAELRTFIASAIAGTLSGGNGAAEPDDQVVTH